MARLRKGDVVGHPFHGNQWTEGRGGSGLGSIPTKIRDLLHEPGSGFSIKVPGENAPTSGFMVSHKEPSLIINPETFFNDDAKAIDKVLDFIRANKGMLDEKDNFLGGWHDPDSGQIFIDISANVQDKAEAIALGKQNDQISIYDVVAGDTISTGGTGGLSNGP